MIDFTTRKEKVQFIILMLFVLTLAITLTINAYPLYVLDIKFLNILDNVDLSQGELLKNYRELMGYLNFPWVKNLKLSDFPVSDSGSFHFFEVKRLFGLNYILFIVTFLPGIGLIRKLWKEGRLWVIGHFLKISALVPLILGFIMFVAFDYVFIMFHELLFNNDAWVFDPTTDPIITVLPEDYFFHCFLLAIMLFELIVLTLYVLGKHQLKKMNKK